MAIEVLYSVISPESGVQKIKGARSPDMGGSPPNPNGSHQKPPEAPPHTPVFTPYTPSPAKRLNTLENKTIYLVDTGYGGSYRFMQQLEIWLKAHLPSVKTIRKRKTGHVFSDDTTDLWEEVKAKGHAVILGVAG